MFICFKNFFTLDINYLVHSGEKVSTSKTSTKQVLDCNLHEQNKKPWLTDFQLEPPYFNIPFKTCKKLAEQQSKDKCVCVSTYHSGIATYLEPESVQLL